MSAIRIEIARMHNGLFEIRIGDLSGSSTHSNATFRDVINEVKWALEELPLYGQRDKSPDVESKLILKSRKTPFRVTDNGNKTADISLCQNCHSMTKTIKGKCGKCGKKK